MSFLGTGSGSIPRNSLLSFLAQLSVVTLAFVCIPPLVRGLGSEAFGLLSVLWMFVGYFSFLDLGVGQAAVKFLSASVATGERARGAALIRRAVKLSLWFGICGGLIVTSLAVIGIEKLFNISPELMGEARGALLVLAVCLPATLVQGSLRSVPLAFNRFGLISLTQGFGGLIQWGGALLAIYMNYGLFGVVVATMLSRYIVVALYGWLTIRLLPEVLRRPPQPDRGLTTLLVRFGGWVSVSQLIAPLLTFIERFSIGAVLSLSWVTFFSVPSEAVIRMLIVPMSIVNALYPFMSSGWSSDDGKNRVKLVYQRSVKYLYLAVVPVVLLLAMFGQEILQSWLGSEFAQKSTLVFMVLSAGYLFNSLSQLPNAALQALGRPDLPAKVALIQLPLYTGLFVAFTMAWGILGSAVAWLIRVACESAALFLLARRIMNPVPNAFDSSYLWKASLLLLGGSVFLVMGRVISIGTGAQLVLVTFIGLLYLVGLWYFAFDEEDRDLLLRHTLKSF